MILYFGNINSDIKIGYSQLEQIHNIMIKNHEIIIASHFKNKLLRMSHMIYVFYKYLFRKKIVYVDTYSGKAFYYTLVISILCKFHRINYIPVCHGGKLGDRLKNNKILSKIIFSNSKTNYTPSKMLMSKLKENNFNCKYVPNFIKTKDYKSRVRGHLRPKILWVRAFHKMYNPTMAIETINILKNKYPEINLCMVGPDKDGSLKDCKNIANEYDITKNIKYTGYLSKNDWHELSNEYDIFINTTNFESFGLSLIEASALGLPLVSTNAGEIKYIYKNNINAMLVDKNDSRAMASQIDKLIENKDLARYLSEHNIKRSKKYNWESIKDNWIKYIPK